jgi:uncharacterized protein (TIGR02001 family)
MEKHMKLAKLSVIATALLSTTAMADWSANVGIVSDYHFRGIQQTESASASAGVDYENGGFYAGVWTAEVEDGLEVDLYGGYGFDITDGVSGSIGYTTYQYTGDFDSAYNEFNFGLSAGMFSLEYSVGTWDGPVDNEMDVDYDFVGLTVEGESGLFATAGFFGKDTEGEYFELGYGTSVGEFDVGLGLVVSGSDLDDSESLYLSLSKSFDL